MEQKDQKAAMVKVKILKNVGPYLAGQEVDVDAETAVHLADGKKGMLAEDYAKKSAAAKDPSKLTVKEMSDLGLKNIVEVPADQMTLKKTEEAALSGAPVAAGEPITVTGGVTPPSTVFPAMAEAAGTPVTSAESVGIKPLGEKKSEAKAADKKPEDKK